MSREREYWIKCAKFLAWFSLFYNILEGIISTWFGIEERSFALFGFGGNSFIEFSSALIVIWRLNHVGRRQEDRDRQAVIMIGSLLIGLSIVSSTGALWQLFAQVHPATTIPGLLISIISICIMTFVWRAKLKAADILQSDVIRSDASCALACLNLSVVLFLGSATYVVYPKFWWVDSFAALLLSLFIAKEGVETIRRPHAHYHSCPDD